MQQAIDRVDHVGILVHRANLARYVDQLSRVLNISFGDPVEIVHAGAIAVHSWDAGLEFLAPLEDQGPFWDRLQEKGEGTVVVIFGVRDIEDAAGIAARNGAPVEYELPLAGDEPWRHRFDTFREMKLTNMFGDDFGAWFALSQIEPAGSPVDARLAGPGPG
jgi:hypothetical protein